MDDSIPVFVVHALQPGGKREIPQPNLVDRYHYHSVSLFIAVGHNTSFSA